MSKPRQILNFIATFWSTFFYSGLSPKAPGTAGSLAALPLAWWAWSLPHPWGWILTAFVFVTGTWAASVRIRLTGVHDHQSIVIDEVVGILLITSIAPRNWSAYLVAFVLFRIFDIWKPWPVSWVDKNWKGGSGTMMDDVLAALMATAIFWVLLQFFPVLVIPA